jgi:threonine dehydrogenase-like Zn-dependent dehydrogenase
VIISMLAGSICGSDIPMFRSGSIVKIESSGRTLDTDNRAAAPMHEVVGTVIATRSEELQVGQRVVGWALAFDGLSEQVVVSASSVHALSDTSSFSPAEQTVIQPLACVIYAADRLPNLQGKRVAIIGLGPIGMLFAHVAHQYGAASVSGIDLVDRSKVASQFGIDECFCMSSELWAQTLSPDDAPDVIIEAVGHQVSTLEHAVQSVRNEGTIYYFGLADDSAYGLDLRAMQRKNVTLMSGVTPYPAHKPCLAKADAYITEHPELPKNLISHAYDTASIQNAYDVAAVASNDRIKVVIEWP